MKKKNLLLAILPLSSSFLFAENANKAGAAVAAINFRVMDIPLLDGMAYFISTIESFGNIALQVVVRNSASSESCC